MGKPRTWTEHLLPFERLSPDDFEGVLQWLLNEEGYKNVRNLGEGGSDEGCDLVAEREGRRVLVQCKRTRQLGPKAAVREVEKVLALPADELPEEYVLAASCTLTLKTERSVRARVAGAFKFRFWALRELDERVRRHGRILERFFGSVTSVSGLPTIPPATRDFAGRTDELEELRRAVSEHGGAMIYGVRGLGGSARRNSASNWSRWWAATTLTATSW